MRTTEEVACSKTFADVLTTVPVLHSLRVEDRCDYHIQVLTLEGINLRKLHEGVKGEGRGQSDPSPLLISYSRPLIRLT